MRKLNFLLYFSAFVFLVSANVSIQDVLRDVDHAIKSEKVDIKKEDARAKKIIRHLLAKNSTLREPNTSSCACEKYNCGCCVHLKWDTIGLDDTVCTNFSYLPAPEYGISVTLTIDGKAIINETVSARNPPPICIGVPYLKKFASICLKFYNLNIQNNSLTGCISIQARLEGLKVESVDLGCFKIPPTDKQEAAQWIHVDRNTDYQLEKVLPGLWKMMNEKNQSGEDDRLYFKSHD